MLSLQEISVAVEIGTIYGILALGIYLTFKVINFPDLTCDGSFITGAAVSSVLIQKMGFNPFLSLLFAMIGSGIAGFITGFLNIWMKIDDLLSGVIVAFTLYSINLKIMGENPNISLVDNTLIFSNAAPLFVDFVIVGILLFVLTYLLNSDFGLGLRSIGENRQFAAANGVNVNTMLIFGLVISNALIGLCGAMFAQYQEFCDVSQGVGCLVIGLASVVIGEKVIPLLEKLAGIAKKIEHRNFIKIFAILVSCIIGSTAYRLFLAVAINSDILGLKTQDINLITGVLIIFFMAMRKKKCYR